MSNNGSAYIWYRDEYIDRPEELGTFTECGSVVGNDGARTISKWRKRYEDFPKVVCQAGEGDAAKKYLVKAEFADWLVAHETEALERDQDFFKRLSEDRARVKKRIADKVEDVRVARSFQEKWSKKN